MMLNWSGFMAVAQLPPSKIIDKTRCTRIPRGDGPGGRHASLNVYWVLGICAGSAQPELARRFIALVAGPQSHSLRAAGGFEFDGIGGDGVPEQRRVYRPQPPYP